MCFNSFRTASLTKASSTSALILVGWRTLLANDGLVLVMRVVRVAELAIRTELKFKELVAEASLMTDSD